MPEVILECRGDNASGCSNRKNKLLFKETMGYMLYTYYTFHGFMFTRVQKL